MTEEGKLAEQLMAALASLLDLYKRATRDDPDNEVRILTIGYVERQIKYTRETLYRLGTDEERARNDLKPWVRTDHPSTGRHQGEVAMAKNGGSLDIWIRVNGIPTWVGVQRKDVEAFLESSREVCHLKAEGGGNMGEPTPRGQR